MQHVLRAWVVTPLVGLFLLAGCGGAGSPPTPTTTTTATALGPATGPVTNHAVDPACGTELWDKKTLTDSDAAKVDPNPVDASSVAQLNAVPDTGAQGPSRVGVELHVYRFTGTLVRVKLEADSDYHVVMADSTGKTLITEYPANECDGHARVAGILAGARDAFTAACGTPSPSGFTNLTGTATVVGVGFYDRDHGQSGRDNLGNGSDAELHPILAFSGSCRAGAVRYGSGKGTD